MNLAFIRAGTVSKQVITLFLLIAFSKLQAQTNFLKTYHSIGYQDVNSITQIEDHNFLIVGDDDEGKLNVFVMKTDVAGTIIWKKFLSNPSSNINFGRQALFANGKYMVLSNGLSMMLSVLDRDSNLLSQHIFTDSLWNGISMDLSLENGLIIACEQNQHNSQLNDIILAKADLDGKVYWAKRYGSATEDERPFKILQLVDGSFLIAGITTELSEYPYYENILLLRISQQGDVIWKKIYGGVEQNIPLDMIKAQDGTYVIIANNTNAQGLVEIMKINVDGEFLWTHQISSQMIGTPRQIAQSKTGEYFVIGERVILFNSPPEPPRSTLLWRFSKDGALLGQREYVIDPRYSSGYAITNADDGGFMAGGRVTNGTDVDFYLLKIGDDGCMIQKPNLGEDNIGCAPIRLSAGSDFDSYTWSTGETTAFIEVKNTGTYSVKVSRDNCFRSDTIHVELKNCAFLDHCNNIGFSENELFFPNVITPNGDEVNEFFYIPDALAGSRLSVYNRWGRLIYQSNNYLNQWNGGDLDTGTYYFKVESKCFDDPFKGFVSLVR